MKSVMEEASTIVKAIESAWERAGKPQEFSIKILEHPETGFLGLKTVKSAKIALFFNENVKPEPVVRPVQRREPQPRRPQYDQRSQPQRSDYRSEPRSDARRDQRPYEPRDQRHPEPREPRPIEPRVIEPRPIDREPREQRSSDSRETRPIWTPEMVAIVQDWLKETLAMTGQEDTPIKAHVSNHFLRLIIEKSVSSDARQEELLLKSWTNLAYDALKEKTKQPLRGLRLIIESKRNGNGGY